MIPSWHRFECLGLKLVYDVSSGSLHLLDEVGWDILEYAEAGGIFDAEAISQELSRKHPPGLIREVFAELAELAEAGQLGGEDPGLAFTPALGAERPLKALCLHIAHSCNITCEYCFASNGTFGGHRTLMSVEVAHAAIDMLLSHSGSRKHCEIDFFGGEPLVNWGVIKDAVEYGTSAASRMGKVIRFTLTTNGVALTTEVMDFLDAHNISVVLSLDGRRDVNDRMRRFYDGPSDQSVYDTIVPKFQEMVARRPGHGYYVRGTYTRANLDFSEDVKHLVELGFDQVSVEPVIGGADDDYSLKEEHLPTLFDQYEKLALWLADRARASKPVHFFHYNLELERGPCLAKRVTGCGAGNEYFAVTPTGELYPCHQFVGRPEFEMGSVRDGIQRPDLRDKFGQCNLVSKPTCRDCWARYFCGGGCHANAQLFGGDISQPYALGCKLQRKRIECGLALHALLNS